MEVPQSVEKQGKAYLFPAVEILEPQSEQTPFEFTTPSQIPNLSGDNTKVHSTVGTKVIADPEKGLKFQELKSEKLLILLQDRPCQELILVSSDFQVLFSVQDKLLASAWNLLVPAKKSQKLLDLPFPESIQ